MKHVLLVSNLSIENQNILEYACSFCKYYSLKLHVLHIDAKKEPVLISTEHHYVKAALKYQEFLIEKTSQSIASKLDKLLDVKMRTIAIRQGISDEVVNQFIHENMIDLILVGKEDLKKDSQKTYEDLLINTIKLPVLIIPDITVFTSLIKFSYLSRSFSKEADYVIKLQHMFQNSVTQVLHFHDDPVTEIQLQKGKTYIKSKSRDRVNFRKSASTFEDYLNNGILNKSKCDAIVLVSKPSKFWARLFDRNSLLHHITQVEIPTLVLKY